MNGSIKQYVYGTPFETFAVVEDVPVANGNPELFEIAQDDISIAFTCSLSDNDIVYGLGETMRGINKRGGRYVSFNTDDPHHRIDMPSLYSSHNFIVIDGARKFGAFFDTPSKVIFEIDYKKSGAVKVICETKNLRLYVFDGDSAYGIVKSFLSVIGRSFIPPLWAFGYGQSRWGYKNEQDINEVIDGYEKTDIPLDYVCMDIDYMDGYADFTVNKNRFPDLKAFADKTKKRGVRLVPIIDAGVKIQAGDKTYEEGVANGYFCTNRDGDNFRVAVWPGMTHFPDFVQPRVREWFGAQYKILTDCGIDGFWNDMNEPAIFYSEYTKKVGLMKMLINAMFPAKQEGNSNAYKDYHNFYHNVNGERVCHYDVHNVYGYFMTMASGEGLKKLLGDKRYLLFSRSSYIGAHRYGGIWTGDNSSCWEHLRQNVYQMPSLNMCGFLYSGADTGGFGGNCSRELLLRWLAFSAFTPLMRNHSSIMTKRQECYRFKNTDDFKSVVSLRYRLLPYIYSEFMKAALRQDMYIKPLAFEYDDEKARTIEDQLLVGESIMIAPVVDKGAVGRKVYLPEDMTEVRYSGSDFVCSPVSRGEKYIDVKLNEVVFYIRKGKCVPVSKFARHTKDIDLSEVTLIGDGTVYEQYIDDGVSQNISPNNIIKLQRQ